MKYHCTLAKTQVSVANLVEVVLQGLHCYHLPNDLVKTLRQPIGPFLPPPCPQYGTNGPQLNRPGI